MSANDRETNLKIFNAFLLGKYVAMRAYNVQVTAATDEAYDILNRIADGKESATPSVEWMLSMVEEADKDNWRKYLETNRPTLIAQERELAAAAVEGMKEYFQI